MRIDRVKLIAEMARQNIKAQDLAEKACVSRCTIVALRGGKSCSENSVKHVAAALGVTVEDLKEDLLSGYHLRGPAHEQSRNRAEP